MRPLWRKGSAAHELAFDGWGPTGRVGLVGGASPVRAASGGEEGRADGVVEEVGDAMDAGVGRDRAHATVSTTTSKKQGERPIILSEHHS
jgi:hypothetical protein